MLMLILLRLIVSFYLISNRLAESPVVETYQLVSVLQTARASELEEFGGGELHQRNTALEKFEISSSKSITSNCIGAKNFLEFATRP